jgi:PKD domain-containing protein
MVRRGTLLTLAVLLCTAAAARPEGVAIDHKAVGCIVVGKYPKMNACFTPASTVARSRVYFRPEGVPSWYYVDMKSDQPCFAGTLPKPGKKLVGKKIEYYVEAQNKAFEPARTAEFDPIVVRSAQECKKNVPVAPFLNNATVAVFPSVPAGFVGAGGIGTAAVVGIVGAGAAAAGTAVAVAGNDNDTTTTTVGVVVNSTTTTTTLAPTTTTTTTPPTTNHAPFAVLTTNPDPPSGTGPLTVTFDLCKSTDADKDPLSFFFDFGDGAKASGSCLESHTYSGNFRGASNLRALDRSYTAEACVVDTGGLSGCRTRTINATSPPPACPAPTVVLAPPPSFLRGCPARAIPVQASTTNTNSVTFCATPVDQSLCGFSPNPPNRNPPVCAAGASSGSTFSATLNVDPNNSDCYRIDADAKGCGGSAKATPEYSFSDNNCFRATDAGARQERILAWSSDLTAEGGRLQVVINGAPPAFPGRGRGTGVAKLVDGENRIEAVLVETAGKAGLWRIDFSPPDYIAEGSLRVISGEAVLLGASSATFRLRGHEGERIVFTFLKK